MKELKFVSQERAIPQIITFTHVIPEEIRDKIVAELKSTYGEDVDYDIRPIQIKVFIK